jgi:hypothetical protein
MSTPIKLTQAGRVIGTAQLHDAGDRFLWPILEMCFPDARTITRDNDGWTVEVEPAEFPARQLYPREWPRCPSCGDYAMDGRATCGRARCGSSWGGK